MKRLSYLIYLIILIVSFVYMVMVGHNVIVMADRVEVLEQTINDQKDLLFQQNLTLSKGIYALTVQNTEIQERIETLEIYITEEPDPAPISRGYERIKPIIMRVTAYDLSYASCRKYPDNPEYGITASGIRVKEWHTIAAGPELPFGTKVYIPYFKDKPNKGIFTVQDRGSAIKENCLDVYMSNNKDCKDFGLRYLEVYILGGNHE